MARHVGRMQQSLRKINLIIRDIQRFPSIACRLEFTANDGPDHPGCSQSIKLLDSLARRLAPRNRATQYPICPVCEWANNLTASRNLSCGADHGSSIKGGALSSSEWNSLLVLANSVFEWLSQQPAWQRDLARRVAASVELDEAKYADALRMVKHFFDPLLEEGLSNITPIEREDLTPGPGAPVSRLLALGSLQGVGLVAENEELTFGPTGLTLIYGQNAVGKSSYVRTLKRICRTVDRECRILGNIYDAGAGATQPSARIRVDIDGAITERRSRLDGSPEVKLPDIGVFDAACAELYVNAQNAVQYVPAELRVLARLAALQDCMRRDLARERQALQEREPSRDAYPAATEVGQALASLRGTAADPDLSALAILSAEQRARIAELNTIIAATAWSTARADALAAEREAKEARELADGLVQLAERASTPVAGRLRKAAADEEAAREALRLATQEFTGPIAGVGGGPWRLMWDAARSFIEATGNHFPPSEGEHCPLCLQMITSDAAGRLAHFHAHVSSSVQAKVESAAIELAGAMDECAASHVDECQVPLLTALGEQEPELARSVKQLINEVAAHLANMQRDPKDADGASFDVDGVVETLITWADGRSAHARILMDAEDPAKRKAAVTELAELDARQRLASELEIFEEWRNRLHTIAALSNAHGALATNRITSAQRELTESEIGRALSAALSDELKLLSCTHLPVELNTRTQVAETRVGLRLLTQQHSAGLPDIGSEGERRALALSFFLAELSVADGTSGIIVDDPVSSLDDERRDYIAQRLVAEAQKRQVIVFTHDLPFLFALRSQAKIDDVPLHFQHIWRLGQTVGRVDSNLPFKTMKLRERIGKLEQELLAVKNAPPKDHETAWHQVNGFYYRLRTSWERAVEECLFAGVVERFERDVKTLKLKDVKVTDELIGRIEQGMTRASMFLHEDAFAAQVTLPSLAEMSNDLDMLRGFERDTR